jgi:glutathione S-transferase
MTTEPLSWQQLAELTNWAIDPINGKTNSQATLRLFGQTEADVRVTLFRDNHAWCPYCQKSSLPHREGNHVLLWQKRELV